MKEPRIGYFSEMNRITERLLDCSQKDPAYLPEYEASKRINELVHHETLPLEQRLEEITRMMEAVHASEHADGSAWHDYKLHLNYTLRFNGVGNVAF